MEEIFESVDEHNILYKMFYETEESVQYLSEWQQEQEEFAIIRWQWQQGNEDNPYTALFKDALHAKEYGNQYTEKLNQFAEMVIHGQTKPKAFNVLSIEAALGKSWAMTAIIRRNMNDLFNPRNFLIVKPFAKDVEEMEQALINTNRRPKGFDDTPNVVGLTKDNWKGEWRYKPEKLKYIQVLIITQKRYLDLCLRGDLRQYFTEERDVLIIDEKVTFPIYSCSNQEYNKVRSKFSKLSDQRILDDLYEGLSNVIEEKSLSSKYGECERVYPKMDEVLLAQCMEEITKCVEEMKGEEYHPKVEGFLKAIRHSYNNMCVYNSGNILTIDKDYKFWGLDNNIILDASACIDGIYNVSDHYNVMSEERIIDYSQSNFYKVNFNTSKTNIDKNPQFFADIAKKIEEYHKQSDQTLVICHKDNCREIERQLLKQGIRDIHIPNEEDQNEEQPGTITKSFAINWFGNLNGKNEYRDFTQCWVIGTPNLSYGQYLMQSMMYTRKKNLGNKPLNIVRGEFKNAELGSVQRGFVNAGIYQGFKRIQRNSRPKGDFFIVNSNPATIIEVLNQFKGVNQVKEIELEFITKKKRERKGRNNAVKLISYLKNELDVGVSHTKKQIKEALSLNDANFNRILKDDEIRSLSESKYIEISHRQIKKLKEIPTD